MLRVSDYSVCDCYPYILHRNSFFYPPPPPLPRFECCITDLNRGANYTVRVRAKGQYKPSPYCRSIKFKLGGGGHSSHYCKVILFYGCNRPETSTSSIKTSQIPILSQDNYFRTHSPPSAPARPVVDKISTTSFMAPFKRAGGRDKIFKRVGGGQDL